jgi:hypothetical protein
VTFLLVVTRVVDMGADRFLFIVVRVPKREAVGRVVDSIGVSGQEGDEGVEILVVDTLLSTEEVLGRNVTVGSQATKTEVAYLHGHRESLQKVNEGLLLDNALEGGLLALKALALPIQRDVDPDLGGIVSHATNHWALPPRRRAPYSPPQGP